MKPALEKAALKHETPSFRYSSTAMSTEAAMSNADAMADSIKTPVFSAVFSPHRLLIKTTGITIVVSSLPMSPVPWSESILFR